MHEKPQRSRAERKDRIQLVTELTCRDAKLVTELDGDIKKEVITKGFDDTLFCLLNICPE